MYELEVSKSSARCHYVDFHDKAVMTEKSVFGSQALGAERRRSPTLAVKVLKRLLRTLGHGWKLNKEYVILCIPLAERN